MSQPDDVRDAFEMWAAADNRRLEANPYEDRLPGNNHYYECDSTNEAYVGWCAALRNSRPDTAAPVHPSLAPGVTETGTPHRMPTTQADLDAIARLEWGKGYEARGAAERALAQPATQETDHG